MSPLRQIPLILTIFIILFSLMGFVDASYLTFEHYQNIIPPCSVVSGCETVLTSAYATMFGLPTSLLGAIYYLIIFSSVFVYLITKREKVLRSALYLTFLGFLMSCYLVYLMAFVLHTYCLYCLVSALTSTVLFIISSFVLVKYKS